MKLYRFTFFVLSYCITHTVVWAAELEYTRVAGLSGKAIAVGSDTMANMMSYWAEEFEFLYPHINIEVDATGSSAAPPALAQGVATIGAMSRELRLSEIRLFEKTYGYPPTVIKVALDAIAIFVKRTNSLDGLTKKQIDAIFSQTRFCGGAENITTWGQLSINGTSSNERITLYGRNSVSGTYGYFKNSVLCNGDFKSSVRELPGSASVVLSVASDKHAIGYAAIGYKTAGVKPLSIAVTSQEFVPLNIQTVRSGAYPLSRYLYVIVNKPPEKALPKLEFEFLRFILSKQGQEMVKRDGYFPISEELIKRQLDLFLD